MTLDIGLQTIRARPFNYWLSFFVDTVSSAITPSATGVDTGTKVIHNYHLGTNLKMKITEHDIK